MIEKEFKDFNLKKHLNCLTPSEAHKNLIIFDHNNNFYPNFKTNDNTYSKQIENFYIKMNNIDKTNIPHFSKESELNKHHNIIKNKIRELSKENSRLQNDFSRDVSENNFYDIQNFHIYYKAREFFDSESSQTNKDTMLINQLKIIILLQFDKTFHDKKFQDITEKINFLLQKYIQFSNAEILRIIYFFDFNLESAKYFIINESKIVLLRFSQEMALKENNKYDLNIARVLSSGFIYCSGRDKFFRPNIYINLDIIKFQDCEMSFLNDINICLNDNTRQKNITIDNQIYNVIDFIYILNYLVNYLIRIAMSPGVVEQFNIILYFSPETYKAKIDKILCNKFRPNDTKSSLKLSFNLLIDNIIEILGKSFLMRLNKMILFINKGELELIESNYQLKFQITKNLKISDENLHLLNNSKDLFEFIIPEQLEQKFDGFQKNINSEFFPPNMYNDYYDTKNENNLIKDKVKNTFKKQKSNIFSQDQKINIKENISPFNHNDTTFHLNNSDDKKSPVSKNKNFSFQNFYDNIYNRSNGRIKNKEKLNSNEDKDKDNTMNSNYKFRPKKTAASESKNELISYIYIR